MAGPLPGALEREHRRPPLNRGSVDPLPEHGREPDRGFAGHDSHFFLGKDEPITGRDEPGSAHDKPETTIDAVWLKIEISAHMRLRA